MTLLAVEVIREGKTWAAKSRKSQSGILNILKQIQKYSQNPELLSETSWNHLVQYLCSSRISWSRLPRAVFSWVLSVSTDEDYITSTSKLCQSLTTFTVKKKKKKCFLVFIVVFIFFTLCLLPPVLLGSLFFFTPVWYLYTLIRPPWAFPSPGWTALSTSPHMKDVPVYNHLHDPHIQDQKSCKAWEGFCKISRRPCILYIFTLKHQTVITKKTNLWG